MVDLKCPYCHEVRTSTGRLQQHVDGMHYEEGTYAERFTAVANARSVETVEVSHDRNTLTEGLTRMNAHLSAAGEQMASMREALDSVDERMKVLDAQLVSPSVIRHATLNEVWDKLMEEGNISGAMIVMDMIKASK